MNQRIVARRLIAALAVALCMGVFAAPVGAESAPATPGAVTVTRADATVTASWAPVATATRYHVTYSTDGGASWHAPVNDNTNVATNSIGFSADNAKTYIVGLRAGNEAGWSGWRNSPPAGPYTPPALEPVNPPAVPVNLAATASDGGATLSWDDPSDPSIAGYEYKVNHNDTWTGRLSGWSGWTAIFGSSATTTSHTIHGLVNGKEYRYRLRAVNAAGAGGVSPGASPWYVSTTPAPPHLNAINATETGATLEIGSWNGDWYYRQDYANGGQAASAASTNANQPQCAGPVSGKRTNVGDLDSDSQYTYGAYQDIQCNVAIASAQVNTLPSAPAKVAKPNVTAASGGGSVSWTALTQNTTGYQLQYRPCVVSYKSDSGGCVWRQQIASPWQSGWAEWNSGDLGANYGHAGQRDNVSTPHNLNVMRNGIYAQVRVRAVNAGGNATNYGPWSDASNDFLPNETPPPHLAVKNVTATGATLELSHHTGSWSYKRTEGPADSTCTDVAAPAAMATLSGLAGGVHYAYAAYSASGCNSADEIAWLGFTTPNIAVYNWNSINGSSVCRVGSLMHLLVNKCTTAFTTGGGFSSYTLSEIKARFAAKTGNPADIIVAIHAADTSNNGNPAASAQVTLSGGNPDAAGWHSFRCSGNNCALNADTTYFVVMSAGQITGNHYYTWTATTSDAEDAVPANNGWSIANTARTSGGLGWNNISNSATGSLYISAAAPALTATNVTGDSATLTFEGRTANWWYKRTQPTEASCTAVTAGSQSVSLSSLDHGTVYEYRAFGEAGCATSLGAANFTTHPLTVSNLSEFADGYYSVGNAGTEYANQFTSGGNSGGYTLRSVTVDIDGKVGDSPGALRIQLWTDSGDSPGSHVSGATLTGNNPPDTGGQAIYYCSGNCSLVASTDYWVVLSAPAATAGEAWDWNYTSSTNETRVPSGNGWQIGTLSYKLTSLSPWAGVSNAGQFTVAATLNQSAGASSAAAEAVAPVAGSAAESPSERAVPAFTAGPFGPQPPARLAKTFEEQASAIEAMAGAGFAARARISLDAPADAGFDGELSAGDALDLVAEVEPDPRHAGLPGVFHLLFVDASGRVSQLGADGEVTGWDGTLAGLVPLRASASLAPVERFAVVRGLILNAGLDDSPWDLFLAYRAGGQLVYASKPLRLRVAD